MKRNYYVQVSAKMRQAITLTLPFMMQPITNGENGEPKEIEVSDISSLCVRLQGVGETGQGKKIGLSGETKYEIDGSNIVLHIASLDDYGYAKAIVSGKYGQVCLRAEVSLLSGTEGETSFSLPAYVFKVVDNSTAAATIVAESVEDLKRAIAELPDGQAVSVKVAEHTVALSKLHILTVDELDTLGNYCTSLADLSEKYSLINLTFTDESGTVVCASILPSTDSEHGWLYEFQEGWRVCKMNEYEFYPENDFLDLASYMDGHSSRLATKEEIGERADLITEAKSNIVAAVNEVSGKVGELEGETNKINDALGGVYQKEETIDFTSLVNKSGAIDRYNKWISSYKHYVIPTTKGAKYKLTPNKTDGTIYAWLKSDKVVVNETPVYADGEVNRHVLGAGTPEIVVTAPNNANFLYFFGDSTYIPTLIKIDIQSPVLDKTPIIKESEKCDFEISDEAEKSIVRFTNGHIQTKNFDSSKIGDIIPILAKYKDKVISVLGDSISTFGTPSSTNEDGTYCYSYYPTATCRYSEDGVDSIKFDVNDTWWMRVINRIGAKLGINESWRGTRVSGTGVNAFNNQERINHLGLNGTPDVILVFGGTNDAGGSVNVGTFNTENPQSYTDEQIASLPVSTFADGYRAMLIRLLKTYPMSEIVVLLPTYTSAYYTITNLDLYIEVIKEACDFFGVKYIDTRTTGINIYNRTSFLSDGIHPNAKGMELIADLVYKHLIFE